MIWAFPMRWWILTISEVRLRIAMKTKTIVIQVLLVVVFFMIALLITLRSKKADYTGFVGFTQGTTYRITYYSKRGEHFQVQVDSILAAVDSSLSIYKPNSVISRLNRNVFGTRPDAMFADLFERSEEINKKTGGAFDITVGPIVNALGFGSGDTMKVDSFLIDSLRSYVGMDKVKIENGNLVKSNPNISLDLNAIAQGYSVDLVAEFLESKGIRNYLVEIGGEVRAKGKNDRNMVWRIGIDRPDEGNMLPGSSLQAIISLKNRSLATSGNYRKFYVKDGIKFVHTINPETGFPVVSNLLSATVIADDCTTADAYATALMVFGTEKAKQFLENHKFLEAYLIYSDDQGNFKVYLTSGLKKFIKD